MFSKCFCEVNPPRQYRRKPVASGKGLCKITAVRAVAFAGWLVATQWINASAADLELPPRRADAPGGMAFATSIAGRDLAAWEREVSAEVEKGNVPQFWRSFVEVRVAGEGGSGHGSAIYFVAPDYFCIGSDDDYFLTPLSPKVAQALADRLGCVLPTRKMVDDIYRAAPVKLPPAPFPPDAAMTTIPAFTEHNHLIRAQRAATLPAHPLGSLVAGHKKDVVVTAQLATSPGKVAIYGWHKRAATPIQPLYLGHGEGWVDYSHGVRFVMRELSVNGIATRVDAVLADPELSGLLSDEGVIAAPRY